MSNLKSIGETVLKISRSQVGRTEGQTDRQTDGRKDGMTEEWPDGQPDFVCGGQKCVTICH